MLKPKLYTAISLADIYQTFANYTSDKQIKATRGAFLRIHWVENSVLKIALLFELIDAHKIDPNVDFSICPLFKK